ncbi:hypothetical protein H6P81_012282 [Aristolochia fimbriata]|uniref:Uncharacterized protein n=1 Tax=Aristolochia fimbriata TaxID=158543 RepID=A0AAV7ECZ7_ARIFI|nr:hypothetical protein H6P81_012282 [Aristolochia fimbriata]
MGTYLDRVKTIVDDLAAAGQPLTFGDRWTHYVVNGLGPTLNRFAQTVLGQVNSPPAPPEAHSAQLDNSFDSAWYIDSGASHISSDASLLTDSGPYNAQDQVMLGYRSGLPISAIGSQYGQTFAQGTE